MRTLLSSLLAEFACKTSYRDLPTTVVEATKAAFLDWLGSSLAGSTREPTPMMSLLVQELGGAPQATVLADGSKNSVTNAALVNGAISHIVELDDVHKASILHAAAAIIPAALAVAESRGASGQDLINAIVCGYEVAIRIGEAITPSHYRYWHTTGTCGTFGAAIAAGKILGLDQQQMIHALGSAGTQASGLWEFLTDGAMSKHLHPGKAAMNGVLSALLSEKGFTAAQRILEGERGFFRATAAAFDTSKITAGLGDSYKIMENCYKIHASCRHTHHAIDVVLQLVGEHLIKPSEIDRILVKTYAVALDITNNHDPRTVFEAKFSLPFCVALAAHRKQAGLNDFNEINLLDPAIRDLMLRVELEVDAELDRAHPDQWPAEVTINTKAGRVFRASTNYPKGDPENPVSLEELQDKFRLLAGLRATPQQVESLITAIASLDQLDDLQELLKIATSPVR
ncbi:MAG: MmgE/PrpD family protein [Bacillota bacterium]